ncbi:metallophosphoesterase [Candidatus Uhrbacteria bacterium]|nr:metallophosphoesterase [Candidatus Uhrbacteria bacterium]
MEFVFDLIIFFYLFAVGAYLVHGVHRWNETQSHRWRLGIFWVLLLSWGGMFYGSFIEPRLIVVDSQQVILDAQGTEHLQAVVVSDLHLGPFKKADWAARVVKQIQTLKPDVIFLLGDFVVSSPQDAKELKPLADLSAPYGVYAVTGNHEYRAKAAPEVIEGLAAAGIRVLQNENIKLEVNGKSVVLAGVSDIWFEGDLKKTLQDVPAEQDVILLAHNPDVVLSPASHLADVILAGHTHGGQIRLPFLGPIAAEPTQLGRGYDKGWFTYEGVKLFITSGVGESGTRARLFIPPEIVSLDITF